MNRHSILFKINVIFLIGLLAILCVFGTVWFIQQKETHFRMGKQFFPLLHALPKASATMDDVTLDTLARRYDFTLVNGDIAASILKHAERFDEKPMMPPPPQDDRFRMTFPSKPEAGERNSFNQPPEFPQPFQIYVYHGNYYYYMETSKRMFKLLVLPNDPFIPILTMLGILPVLLVLMYVTTRQSLKPLGLLFKEIRAFGEGKKLALKKSDRKDEVAQISNAFYDSAKKIQYLTDSRKLFLRNIMHEFNTPIAKGRIIAEMSTDHNKVILENIFSRLELLVQELSDTEKVTSGNISCNFKEYRIIDIIDHARDQLYMDDEIQTDITNETLRCDYAMMSLVFKNLIDNANKHGQSLYISYTKGTVSFISKGEKLIYPLSYYTEPFTQENFSDISNKGLGLGLYIVNEILKQQRFTLSYTCEHGNNIFTIGLT